MLRFVRFFRVVIGSLLALGQWGCLEDQFPTDYNPTPATCGNGTCEIPGEDCDNCPADCDCCSVISSAASDNVEAEANILGASDGNSATLNGFSSIVLVIGREIFNREGGGGASEPDFTIVGEVTSDSQAQTIACASASSGAGAFEVAVSLDGSNYRFVGFWTRDTKQFDIGCGQLKSARFIRLQGQPAAQGTLDAIVSDACIDTPATP